MKRGQISRFVRGKDRKESLSRQMRMDQLKDRFQFTGGLKDKPNTNDDEDTYGPKISQKAPASDGSSEAKRQKIDLTDSHSDSHSVDEMGGKQKCKDVLEGLQSLPCQKVSSVSEGEAGQSIVESECSKLSVKKVIKDSNLEEDKRGMNVEKTLEASNEKIIDHQRVDKREKDNVVEELPHLQWKEGYDRVLPEVGLC